MYREVDKNMPISSHWSDPEAFAVELPLELRPNETKH